MKNSFIALSGILFLLASNPALAVSLRTETEYTGDLDDIGQPPDNVLFHELRLAAHPPDDASEAKPIDPLNGRATSILNVGKNEKHGTTANSRAVGFFRRENDDINNLILTPVLNIDTTISPGIKKPPETVAATGVARFSSLIGVDTAIGTEKKVKAQVILKKDTSLSTSGGSRIKLTELITPFSYLTSSEEISLYDIDIEALVDPISQELSINSLVKLGISNSFLNIEYDKSVEEISETIISAFDSAGVVKNNAILFTASLTLSEEITGFSSKKDGTSNDSGVETVPEPLNILGVGTAVIFGRFFKKNNQKSSNRVAKRGN